MSVMQERTFWRDLAFSLRHRFYGNDCCAVDIDHLPFRFVEYCYPEPAGIIEYKHECAGEQHYLRPNFRALVRLGDRAELPVFCVRYAADFSKFIIDPLNDYASKFTSGRTTLSELDYVKFLHTLRGLDYHENYYRSLLRKADEAK